MKETLKYIPVKDLFPSRTPLRPVRKNTIEYVEFVESVRTDGILQPILVRPHSDKHEVVEGNNRLAAALEVGIELMPCIIKKMTNHEASILQLKCNAVKPAETMNFEYARRLRKLLVEGETVLSLSAKIDKHPGWIRKILKLNDLCDEAKVKVSNGAVKISSAVMLATLPRHLQKNFVDDAVKMQVAPFCNRVREAKQNMDSFLLKSRQSDLELGLLPRLRPVSQIMKEADDKRNEKKVLRACKAKTPSHGWKACLAWIMRIDPVTIMERREGIKEEQISRLNNYQWRMKQREMIENLTFPKVTGEYK